MTGAVQLRPEFDEKAAQSGRGETPWSRKIAITRPSASCAIAGSEGPSTVEGMLQHSAIGENVARRETASARVHLGVLSMRPV